MKKFANKKEELEFWQKRLAEHQKKYRQLRQESPDRWWHDEHFDIQLRVLESMIVEAKTRIKELEADKEK